MNGTTRSTVIVAALALVLGAWLGLPWTDCVSCHPCCAPAPHGGAATPVVDAPGCCPSATAGPAAGTPSATLCPPPPTATPDAVAVTASSADAPDTSSRASAPKAVRSVDRCTLYASLLI